MKEKDDIKLGKGIMAQIEDTATNINLWDSSLTWEKPTQYIKTGGTETKVEYNQPLINYDNVTHYWTSNNDKLLEEMRKYVKSTLGDDWSVDLNQLNKFVGSEKKEDKRTCNKRKRLEM